MTCQQQVYEEALQYAIRKHEGQTRIDGLPYITHPIAVAEIIREKGYGIDYQITALFHDLLEDTDATKEQILRFGNDRILEAVELLTKRPGYVMEDYISGIRGNEIAFVVKGVDRYHNLLSATCTDDTFKRKYIKETEEWFLDFMPEIKDALDQLKKQRMDNKI